jgi:predicted DNA-binding helix-hairpin-helix protein
MLTTACERNCYYCPFRAGRSRTRRVTLRPDELAQGFDRLQQTGQVEGLFLSSGIIKGSVTTQDKIIETAEILRRRYHYRGYLHLKLMPGVETEQLYRLMKLADRVSVNLEGPTPERVAALAPGKEFQRELLSTLEQAERIRRAHPEQRLAGTVTQFVVGAVGDTDHELLSLTQRLYQEDGLTRAYYSGFSPLIQTPFENLPATDPTREHRLYQASFLLRDYGWRVEELTFGEQGNLPLDLDPKHTWAERYLRDAPLEIMQASREQLLHVPGIGPRAAVAILRARRLGRLTDLSDLRHLRISAPERAAPYILLDGTRPVTQLRLFA